MFQIKVCGITSVADARMVCGAGVDAVGLNFYPKSPRYLDDDRAMNIAAEISRSVKRIGVFVNETRDSIRRTFERCELNAAQLHGDEPFEFARDLQLPIVRAFRFRGDLEPILTFVRRALEDGVDLRAVLVDGFHPDSYGGAGVRVAENDAIQLREALTSIPLILAGGLTPFNVRAAIETVRPLGVDTASGVEDAPGKKSRSLVEKFVEESRLGFRGIAEIRSS